MLGNPARSAGGERQRRKVADDERGIDRAQPSGFLGDAAVPLASRRSSAATVAVKSIARPCGCTMPTSLATLSIVTPRPSSFGNSHGGTVGA